MTFLEQTQQILSVLGLLINVFGVPVLIVLWQQKGKENTNKEIAQNKEKEDEKQGRNKEMEVIMAAKLEIFKAGLEGELKSMAAVMGAKIEALTAAFVDIKKNDLHSIYEKQRDQDSQIQKLTVSNENIRTIIDERIPKKA